MLPSIILFLALVSLGWSIVKYRIAVYESETKLDLTPFLISLIVTALLFSIFYYLTHWIMENPQEFLDKNLEELKKL